MDVFVCLWKIHVRKGTKLGVKNPHLGVETALVPCYNLITIYTKGFQLSMTISELKMILEDLSDDTVILIEDSDINEVETIHIEIHRDGRAHLILSAFE